MTLPIPPSFVAYATDPEVRAAVNGLLEDDLVRRRSRGIPNSLGWCDLPAFYQAVLSAHQARCEFAMLLHGIGKAIWCPAWERIELGEERGQLTVVEAQEWHNQKLDPTTVWEEEWFGGTFWFRVAGSRYEVGLGTSIDEAFRVQLSLDVYLPASDASVTDELQLDDELWPAEHMEDSCAWTSPELVTINGPEVELRELHRAAANAFDRVAAYVRE